MVIMIGIKYQGRFCRGYIVIVYGGVWSLGYLVCRWFGPLESSLFWGEEKQSLERLRHLKSTRAFGCSYDWFQYAILFLGGLHPLPHSHTFVGTLLSVVWGLSGHSSYFAKDSPYLNLKCLDTFIISLRSKSLPRDIFVFYYHHSQDLFLILYCIHNKDTQTQQQIHLSLLTLIEFWAPHIFHNIPNGKLVQNWYCDLAK